jgi:hypothetical protein
MTVGAAVGLGDGGDVGSIRGCVGAAVGGDVG